MQETAIDWLVSKFYEVKLLTPYQKDIIKQAKEKEKEQIINAHTNAYLIGEDNISVEDANKASEQYYNQTYNKLTYETIYRRTSKELS